MDFVVEVFALIIIGAIAVLIAVLVLFLIALLIKALRGTL